jgi:hypothetical protein
MNMLLFLVPKAKPIQFATYIYKWAQKLKGVNLDDDTLNLEDREPILISRDEMHSGLQHSGK